MIYYLLIRGAKTRSIKGGKHHGQEESQGIS